MADGVILILGNGFDKSCDLASNYSEFYDYQKGKNNELAFLESEITQLRDDLKGLNGYGTFKSVNPTMDFFDHINGKLTQTNFWESLFTYYSVIQNELALWRNVEEAIQFFIQDKDSSSGMAQIILHTIGIFFQNKDINKEKFPEDRTIESFENLNDVSGKIDYVVIFSLAYNKNLLHRRNLTESMIYDFLKSELRKYEEQFCKYLAYRVDEKEITKKVKNINIKEPYDYFSNANKKIKKIRKVSNIDMSIPIHLINFNYTSHEKKILQNHNIVSQTNIHGSINEKDAIFGVDHINFDSSKPNYLFTKTSRILEKQIASNSLTPDRLPDTCSKIIIYGHSLGEYDYSYFQSLFDLYDLYSSNIEIIFLYSIYDKKEKASILNDNHKTLVALIEKYGKSFDNKEKGKNLIHKLLLENRLKTKEI